MLWAYGSDVSHGNNTASYVDCEMVAIYTLDETFIKNSAEAAKDILEIVYGTKFGKEAYEAVKDGYIGRSYRNNGGPLVQVVTKEKAEWIRQKETSLYMMA